MQNRRYRDVQNITSSIKQEHQSKSRPLWIVFVRLSFELNFWSSNWDCDFCPLASIFSSIVYLYLFSEFSVKEIFFAEFRRKVCHTEISEILRTIENFRSKTTSILRSVFLF